MKKLLVLSLVLLLGVTGFAKRDDFDDVFIHGDVEVEGTVTFTDIDIVGDLGLTGNAAFDGATMSFDGSTHVLNISAGYIGNQAADIRFGYSDHYMKFVVSDATGNLAITHVGGSTDAITWTAAGGFDLVGAIALDAITSVGNLSVDGTTAIIDGATSTREVSAGFTSHESPANRFGSDSSVYMQIATTATTGITAITHTGNGVTVDWTAPVFTFTNSTSMSTFTPSWVMGYDVGAAMTVAVSDTSGITAITHAGNAVTVTWTAPSFDFVGSTALDDTLISTTLGIGTDLSMVGTTGTHDFILTDSVADALSIRRNTTDMMVFNTATPLITITPNTSIVGDLAVDGTSNLDDVDIDGTVDIASFFDMGTMDAGIAVTTANPFAMEVHTEPLTTLTAGDTGISAGIRSRYHVSVAQPNTIGLVAVESRLRVKHAVAGGNHSAVSGVIEASGTDADFTGTTTTQRSAGFFALDFDADVTLADDGWLTGITINSSVNGSVSMAATKFVGLKISTNAGSEVWESDIELQGGATFVNSTDTTLTIAETNIGLTGDVVVTGSLSSTVPKNYDALLSSTEVDVNAVTTTALYTVPTGTSCIVTRIVIRSANKSLDQGTDATSNIGFDAATDLVTSGDISKVLTGTGTWDLLTLVNPGVMGTTTQVLNWHNTAGCTTADSTLQVDVFGYLF